MRIKYHLDLKTSKAENPKDRLTEKKVLLRNEAGLFL